MSAENHTTLVTPTCPPEPWRRWKLQRRRIAGMYTSPAMLTETVWALARHGGVRNCEMEGVAACRMTIRV